MTVEDLIQELNTLVSNSPHLEYADVWVSGIGPVEEIQAGKSVSGGGAWKVVISGRFDTSDLGNEIGSVRDEADTLRHDLEQNSAIYDEERARWEEEARKMHNEMDAVTKELLEAKKQVEDTKREAEEVIREWVEETNRLIKQDKEDRHWIMSLEEENAKLKENLECYAQAEKQWMQENERLKAGNGGSDLLERIRELVNAENAKLGNMVKMYQSALGAITRELDYVRKCEEDYCSNKGVLPSENSMP